VKIKLDENIPVGQPTPFWASMDVDTVADEGLTGADDRTVFEAAQREGRFLITQDLDFSDIRRFTPGTHAGLLLLRLRDPSRRALQERLEVIFSYEDVDSWPGCFVVATDSKIRIRRP
jgi:predicted nuclease of predicted toxin-antitoxin system